MISDLPVFVFPMSFSIFFFSPVLLRRGVREQLGRALAASQSQPTAARQGNGSSPPVPLWHQHRFKVWKFIQMHIWVLCMQRWINLFLPNLIKKKPHLFRVGRLGHQDIHCDKISLFKPNNSISHFHHPLQSPLSNSTSQTAVLFSGAFAFAVSTMPLCLMHLHIHHSNYKKPEKLWRFFLFGFGYYFLFFFLNLTEKGY